jgi:hypothetical protein
MKTAAGLQRQVGDRYEVRNHFHTQRNEKLCQDKIHTRVKKITLYFLFVFNPQTASILPT